MTNIQSEYFDLPFTRDDLLADPIVQFKVWFEQAKNKGEIEPSAMSFATVNKEYEVSSRMLLMKSFDAKGFVFYTNYQSPKAAALQEVPKAAMVFWWPLCQRQVRISGSVKRIDEKDSDAYFVTRSKDSRIAALISQQSQIIPNREYLLKKFQAVSQEKADVEIARPSFWGGYVLTPETIEFWQGRKHRLHDRFLYVKNKTEWIITQLSP